jgi:glycosyltransferase involved in cell wall biosynthesis
MPRIFLLSPYHSGSHAAWAEGFARHSRNDVRLLTMAGRFWKWRMQGGAIEQARQAAAACQAGDRPAALVITDMVNLPALLALARPWLDSVPALLYAHENQLTYPPPPGETRDLTYGLINVLSMLCANRIAFNSQHHLDEFFAELPRLLKHFPDYNHLEIIPELRARSLVLPVGLDLARLDACRTPPRPAEAPLRILWNQRWEYDKNPAEFFAALYALDAADLPFEVCVAGETFRQQPAEFEAARAQLGRRIIHWGYAESRETYARLLWESDLVVSTAYHEFFGISILEAMYCGCYPLLPHRLSYPELLPPEQHGPHLYRGFDDLAARLKAAALHPAAIRQTNLNAIAAAYDWQRLAPVYDAVIEEMAGQREK